MYRFKTMKKIIYSTLFFSVLLTGCGDKTQKTIGAPIDSEDRAKLTFGSLAGEEGFQFGGPKKESATKTHLNINPFLWRATLDTLGFMPLASADSMGGILVSDWYTSTDKPHERIKLTVMIKSKELRADGIQIVLSKQTQRNGAWGPVEQDNVLARQLEDMILTRARDLRINARSAK